MSKVFPSKGVSSRTLTRRERMERNLWYYQQLASKSLLKAAVVYGEALHAVPPSDIAKTHRRLVRAYRRFVSLGCTK